MIEIPPVCLAQDHWFVGIRRSDDTGQWLYAMVGGRDEDFGLGDITAAWGPVTWFVLTEAPHLDGDTPL